MSDPIVAAVQADLAARSALGLAKYRATLARTDLSHAAWLQHAYEEALDLACYLKRAMYQLPAGTPEGGDKLSPAASVPLCVSSQPVSTPANCAPVGDKPAGAAFLGSRCRKCNKLKLRPGMYCWDCFEADRP